MSLKCILVFPLTGDHTVHVESYWTQNIGRKACTQRSCQEHGSANCTLSCKFAVAPAESFAQSMWMALGLHCVADKVFSHFLDWIAVFRVCKLTKHVLPSKHVKMSTWARAGLHVNLTCTPSYGRRSFHVAACFLHTLLCMAIFVAASVMIFGSTFEHNVVFSMQLPNRCNGCKRAVRSVMLELLWIF